jgi:hypothetical protein
MHEMIAINRAHAKGIEYVEWGKAAVIAALANGAVVALLFNIPDRVAVPLFVIFLPGMLIFLPVILAQFHNVWTGYLILGMVANWFIYTVLLYWLIKRRRRKSRAGGPGKAAF